MTEREKEILEIIRENPLISQKEIADKLGIKRSSVGVHVANLMNKGQIIGKGYVLKNDNYVCVIGGCNVDITGKPTNSIIQRDSNIGIISTSLGGVGRNIAENIARLGIKTKLLSSIGQDEFADLIVKGSTESGVDMENVLVSDVKTSVYLAILDDNNDMLYAISQMDAMESLDVSYIEDEKRIINNAQIIVLDTNLPEESISYLLDNFSNYFIVDGVSTSKVKKLKNHLDKINLLKVNLQELESLFERVISSDEDIIKYCKKAISLGCKEIIVTRGSKNSFYVSDTKILRIINPPLLAKNTTGAGDAFVSGIAYGKYMEWDIDLVLKLGVSCATLTLLSETTNCKNLTIEKAIKNMEGIKIC